MTAEQTISWILVLALPATLPALAIGALCYLALVSTRRQAFA